MEFGTFFLLLAVALMVAWYVSRPFLTRARSLPRHDPLLSALLAERDRLLGAIQDLDFDHSLGKIPEADYLAQRASLFHAGAEVLRRLDEHTGVPGRSAKKNAASTVTDEDLEDLIAARRSSRREKTGGFCPQCGKAVLLADVFCPKCGQSLKKKESS